MGIFVVGCGRPIHRQKESVWPQRDLEEILRINDSSLKARLGIALVATMKGEYDKAERLYNYVIDKLPKNAAAYEGRARLFLNKGMKGYALRDINKAFECATPPAASLFVLRGEINAAIGDKKAAAEDYAAAESRGYSKESLDRGSDAWMVLHPSRVAAIARRASTSYAQPSANSKRKGRKDKKPALLFRVDSACTFCLLMTQCDVY